MAMQENNKEITVVGGKLIFAILRVLHLKELCHWPPHNNLYSRASVASEELNQKFYFFRHTDPDQSIYGFRSAEPKNFRKMQNDFSGIGVINMEQNYRSTGKILKAALHVISQGNRTNTFLNTDQWNECNFLSLKIQVVSRSHCVRPIQMENQFSVYQQTTKKVKPNSWQPKSRRWFVVQWASSITKISQYWCEWISCHVISRRFSSAIKSPSLL